MFCMVICMELPKRKTIRLREYNYNTPGVYFITICTKDKQKLLGRIVGTGVLDGPKMYLSKQGKIAHKYICQMNDFYDHIEVDKYVIMPNHIHFLLRVRYDDRGGPSGTPVPTVANSVVSRFVSTFKRFCNKEYAQNIWQGRSHDHVVRNERDYQRIWQYIDTNPAKWQEDCFYIP